MTLQVQQRLFFVTFLYVLLMWPVLRLQQELPVIVKTEHVIRYSIHLPTTDELTKPKLRFKHGFPPGKKI